jgi:isoaspartyl peptidase/L-asparaginase-like protein (Ntn-hydrolase superfamily)
MAFKRIILTHGGAGADPQHADGTLAAATVGMEFLQQGQSALNAAVRAVRCLEDDPRFNAGTGSRLRADGVTMQMDAACMTSDGAFGAVSGVDGVANPIDIAQAVLLHSPHILITAEGATQFARKQRLDLRPLPDRDANHEDSPGTASHQTPACDTVGAITFDGESFASALSSGGLAGSAIGRVGDVPLPGCGLHCGPAGAVACTGDGEFIALRMLAREVYGWLEQNQAPDQVVKRALTLFAKDVDVGLIVTTGSAYAAACRNRMPWSYVTG